ncbi:MAG: bifunctional [glutamate--ammonia ligase]-adenylyl-L-tyrosine phosphorylase/[glutamate--ammonia-ligase] adenylyltransferase [Xanthomonadales bacterium]|nr:bifunctional [glutamate--ammonia ligase]-adenylyl-L-tyrosine phosphorylase/[glutamate--ammonia-ligase] adenylyltransferase [Xanthomonadales bacterium]
MLSIGQNPVLDLSPFLDQLVNRHPDWVDELNTSGRFETTDPPSGDRLSRDIESLGLDSALRQFRNREMLRLIWRDLGGLAPVDETLADLSVLAETCLQAAVDHHVHDMQKKYGIPRNQEGRGQEIVVIGLGKLGGYELNLSSDIDIVFCYPQQGVCDGQRGLANEQFFTRLARNIIRSLSMVTADGFCFRVDTRLRPFGESGPLVSSFAALEQYYQREGRDWERYALIKARPVAGDLASGRRLLQILKPFIYRRYIDFGAIEALRDMHASVREDALSKNRLDDIKRGPGGIREIEFLVQAFQLLRGGREHILQTTSVLKAADGLKQLQVLPAETIDRLLDAYRFLRRVENRVQALHDQQTHRVPTGVDGLRVARAMEFEEYDEFLAALQNIRQDVQDLFEDSLPQAASETGEDNPWYSAWRKMRNTRRTDTPDSPNARPLADFVKRLNRLSLSQRAARRLDQFMPVLLQRIDALALEDAIVYRVLDLVSAVCQRSAYLSLLVQNPDATDRMLELFSISQRVAQTVTRYPALLDELIDPSLGARPPEIEGIRAGLDHVLAGITDTEAALQALNDFKQIITLRIAVATLQSTITATRAMTLLSHLAGDLVQSVLDLALLDMYNRHGSLPGPELAVIAYGSLGAETLGFDSDLDLIFLYQSTTNLSEGPRPITAERYHTGVARRMLSLLSASTPAGKLYSIDARLRPNGRAGLLVSSLEAFSRYQAEEAWTWELQALTRARPVAGNSAVAERFVDIRRSVLSQERETEQARREILEMRYRIDDQHSGTESLKYAPGGLLDIEFIVQLGVLLKAGQFPAVMKSTRCDEQIQALHRCGWFNDNGTEILQTAFARLQNHRLQSSLLDQETGAEKGPLLEIAAALCDDILR